MVLLDIWRAQFLSADVSNSTKWAIVRLERHFLLHGYPVVCLVGVYKSQAFPISAAAIGLAQIRAACKVLAPPE
jgi:hypothetical protein